jgi:hypothetical protein
VLGDDLEAVVGRDPDGLDHRLMEGVADGGELLLGAPFLQVDPDQRNGMSLPVGGRDRPGPPTRGTPSRSGAYTWGQDRRAEATMALLINLIIFAGIVLLPLGLAFIFMRLRRRFSSYY